MSRNKIQYVKHLVENTEEKLMGLILDRLRMLVWRMPEEFNEKGERNPFGSGSRLQCAAGNG